MCWTCFKEYTDAPVVNERVVAAYRMIRDAGEDAHFGFLHIIVGDMNVDDWLFDLNNMKKNEEFANARPWERAIFRSLAALSEPERATAIAMEWGYILPDGTLRAGLS